MSLRTVPIHRSLHRNNSFMGGDREVIMFTALISISSASLGQNLISIFFGVALWLIVLTISRKITKSDPQMRYVWLANLRFKQRYFPPHSHALVHPNNNYKTTITGKGMISGNGMKYTK